MALVKLRHVKEEDWSVFDEMVVAAVVFTEGANVEESGPNVAVLSDMIQKKMI